MRIALALVVLAGCKGMFEPVKLDNVPESVATAPAGDLSPAVDPAKPGSPPPPGGAHDEPTDRVRVQMDLVAIRGAVLQYQRLHDGQNPPSISELEQLERLSYPREYDYDAASGTVKSKTFPML